MYHPAVFTAHESGAFVETLLAEIPWSQETMQMYEELVDVPLVIVALPTPLEIGPSESTWLKVPQAALTPIDWGQSWHRILTNSGVDYIDFWPAFAADIKSPQHQARYGTVDAHLTAHGRSLVAAYIVEHLRRFLPK